MKQKILGHLKQELTHLETAEGVPEMEKHIYAMERLLDILKSEHENLSDETETTQSLSSQEEKMLELMGGKKTPRKTVKEQTLNGEQKKTDDGVGNGDNIFDF